MREPGAPRNFVPELSSTYAGPVLVNLVSDIINLLYVIFSQISCPFYRVHRGHPIPFRQRGRKEAQALSYICVALELCCDEQSVCNSYFLNIVVYDTTALLFLHSVFFECCIYIYIYIYIYLYATIIAFVISLATGSCSRLYVTAAHHNICKERSVTQLQICKRKLPLICTLSYIL